MMGLHQLSPSRSFLVAYGTDDDPVERDSLGTAIGCLVHAGRLSNPRGNCQFKMNGPLRCYISETLTEPLCQGCQLQTRQPSVARIPARSLQFSPPFFVIKGRGASRAVKGTFCSRGIAGRGVPVR